MNESAAQWELRESRVDLTCGPLTGFIDLNVLGGGLLKAAWNGRTADFHVLQLRPPLVELPGRELIESYVRGSDLVATFERRPPVTVAPQIYWRARYHPPLSAAALEVVISMHTDLLDSEPYSAVDSVGSNCELWHSTIMDREGFERYTSQGPIHFTASESQTHLFVFRSGELSYVEMVHPADFVAAEVDFRGEALGSLRVRSLLFPERLEKGVIRRGRVCGWFMPAENDLVNAVELARHFVDEALPLTA
jgi:hypothetical protein